MSTYTIYVPIKADAKLSKYKHLPNVPFSRNMPHGTDGLYVVEDYEYGVPPEFPSVTLTEEEYEALNSNRKTKAAREVRKKVDELFRIREIEEYKQKLNQLIGQIRCSAMPQIIGQADIYKEKVEQALEFVADPAIAKYEYVRSKYPFIAMEAELRGMSTTEVAESILKKRQQWLALNIKLERIRLEFNIKSETDSDLDTLLLEAKEQLKGLY